MFKIYLLLGVLSVSQFAFANAEQVKQEILTTYGCQQNQFVCKAIDENLKRDTNGCRVTPDSIDLLEPYIRQRNPALTQISVFDRIRYFGPVTGKYSYDYLRLKNRNFKVTARVHFKNLKDFSQAEVQTMVQKFKQAAQIWNRNNPFGDIYNFDFQLALNSSSQTVSANLVKFYTRGPYFDKWSTQWTADTIAHEFGHVLGLFDEYDYFHQSTSAFDCDQSSIMCSSYGRPKPYHYHLILQRSFCEV